jgi:hypothetical protein
MVRTRLEVENRIAKLSINMEKNARLVAKWKRILKNIKD